MTNKEAIKIINNMPNCKPWEVEALAMAIQALEQEPSGDFISRQAVIDILTRNGVHFCDMVKITSDLKELPSAIPKPKTGWIPVSEALPPRDENVLTYHRNESFDYQYVSWIDDYSGKWAGFIGNLSDEVLAWMPLPEPYEESEVEG